MGRSLKDMTLEELWQLFPIVLTPHDPQWPVWANEEITHLTNILPGYNKTISHIGSTAIPGIKAKPIIDILIEIPEDADLPAIRTLMESSGYICMAIADERMSFNKGYTPNGYEERVFHIHFHRLGDNDEILFRNYLIEHPEIAKEYECLKTSLLPQFKYNRDGYTDAKSSFVRHIVAIAKGNNDGKPNQ